MYIRTSCYTLFAQRDGIKKGMSRNNSSINHSKKDERLMNEAQKRNGPKE